MPPLSALCLNVCSLYAVQCSACVHHHSSCLGTHAHLKLNMASRVTVAVLLGLEVLQSTAIQTEESQIPFFVQKAR